MSQQKTLTCHTCKEKFLKSEMVEITSFSGKTSNWYCQKCANEKHAREAFSDVVCYIFGIKAPGPRIWTERKRLIDKYGYTDNVIIDCLKYLYKVEKKNKIAESLYLINPSSVDRMISWKKGEKREAMQLAAAYKTETKEHIVSIKENTTQKNEELNPDSWLED